MRSTHTQGRRVGGCAGHSVPPDPPHMLLAQPGNYREPPIPYPNDPYSAGDPPCTTAQDTWEKDTDTQVAHKVLMKIW